MGNIETEDLGLKLSNIDHWVMRTRTTIPTGRKKKEKKNKTSARILYMWNVAAVSGQPMRSSACFLASGSSSDVFL